MGKKIEFLNRGISGNRVIELYGRICEDMIALKPDIVSILVGVNDGPQAEHGRHATGGAYGQIYRQWLKYAGHLLGGDEDEIYKI